MFCLCITAWHSLHCGNFLNIMIFYFIVGFVFKLQVKWVLATCYHLLIRFLGKILHSCSFERVSCVLLSPEHGFPKLLRKYNKKCRFIFFRFHVSFACIVCVWGRKKEIFPIWKVISIPKSSSVWEHNETSQEDSMNAAANLQMN